MPLFVCPSISLAISRIFSLLTLLQGLLRRVKWRQTASTLSQGEICTFQGEGQSGLCNAACTWFSPNSISIGALPQTPLGKLTALSQTT